MNFTATYINILTPSKAVWFQSKSSSLHVSLRRHNSGTNCARELFNPQKTRQDFKSAMKNKFLVLFFFVSDIMSNFESPEPEKSPPWMKKQYRTNVTLLCETFAVCNQNATAVRQSALSTFWLFAHFPQCHIMLEQLSMCLNIFSFFCA